MKKEDSKEPQKSCGKLNRRTFIQKSALGFSGIGLLGTLPFSMNPGSSSPEYPFKLGVASGEPLPDGVVLWTRLAPDPLQGGGFNQEIIPIQWELALDRDFQEIIQSGEELAGPEFAHSIHLEVSGLEPSQYYYYRFRSGEHISPVGRTKTTPASGSLPSQMRFAIASCQNYSAGYYTAYDHLIQEDLDVVFFLGDYIYEKGSSPKALRKHLPEKEIMTLEDYRIRYGQYKMDPSLMKAHAQFPWVVVPDDHEIKNNWGGEGPPYENNEAFLQRRAIAFQVYYEHMPLRKSSIPKGIFMDIYRKFNFGDLAEFSMLDTRQFRTDFACSGNFEEDCAARFDPERTMLGLEQEKWLADNLIHSTAKWNLLGQQVGMAQVGRKINGAMTYGMDKWDGYAATRSRLFECIEKNQVENLVVLTGDSHKNWVNELHLDPDDPGSQILGTEFMGTSISSAGDGKEVSELGKELMADNPHIKFFNEQRGYVLFTLTPEKLVSEFRTLPFVTQANAPIKTVARFQIDHSKAGCRQLDV